MGHAIIIIISLLTEKGQKKNAHEILIWYTVIKAIKNVNYMNHQ